VRTQLRDLRERQAEKAAMDIIFTNALASLAEEDRSIPQVPAARRVGGRAGGAIAYGAARAQIVNILPLLKRGIGVHHSGLLPIIKVTCVHVCAAAHEAGCGARAHAGACGDSVSGVAREDSVRYGDICAGCVGVHSFVPASRH
jgi:hypothetical protein